MIVANGNKKVPQVPEKAKQLLTGK